MRGKSYVGITQCFYCGGDAGLVIDRRLEPLYEQHVGVVNHEPCAECLGYMEQGVILIGTRDGEEGDNPYRTGEFLVVVDSVIGRMVDSEELAEKVLKARFAFVPQSVLKAAGLLDYAKENNG